MGLINSVTCKNKNCRYHAELYEGPGMIGFAKMLRYRDAILSGEIKNEDVKKRLQNGAEINTRAAYLCPDCRKFLNDNTYYLKENFVKSPFGTVRYVSFPFGKPVCPDCGAELIYIDNIRSGKVKCPKCGGDLKAKHIGYVD